MRILVIEDNIRLADTIADALRCENYIVDIANDGVQGYEDAASGIYDMLILDLMLPKMNGYEVLSTLRREGNDIPACRSWISWCTRLRVIACMRIRSSWISNGLVT